MTEIDTTEATETKTVDTKKKISLPKVNKRDVIIGGTSFLAGILAGIGGVFGFRKIKSSKKK